MSGFLNFGKGMEEFLSFLNRKGFKKRTQEGYRQILNHFCSFLKDRGKTDVRSVMRNDLNDYTLLLHQKLPSPETRRTYVWRLRAFFDFLEGEHFLFINPAENLFIGKSSPSLKLPDILTRHEVNKILSIPFESFSLGARDKALTELLYSSGLRVGEVIRLKPENVDFKNGFVFIDQGKGEKDRVVPLGEKASVALTNYLRQLREKINRHQRQEVFLSLTGRPMGKNLIAHHLKKYARHCGITKRIYPHLFRHTMATHLLEGGAPFAAVSGMLGHASLSTTQLYTQVRPVELKRWYNRCHPQARFLKGIMAVIASDSSAVIARHEVLSFPPRVES